MLDKRINPFRDDLASDTLQGRVTAPCFVAGIKKAVIAPLVSMYRQPSFTEAPIDTQILMGDTFTVYDIKDGWVWGQAESDNYVGYIPSYLLGAPTLEDWITPPTHRVNTLRTFFYPKPDIKIPPLGFISLNSGVHITDSEGNFARLTTGYYIYKDHLSSWQNPINNDFVTVAEQFIGTPYLWGGKSSIGIDCSGLVQTALAAANSQAPRDSDMQEAQLGTSVEPKSDFSNLQRGDLIFWKGHVAIMTSPSLMLHATAYKMITFMEPFLEAEKRIREKMGSPITTIKRLTKLG